MKIRMEVIIHTEDMTEALNVIRYGTDLFNVDYEVLEMEREND